MRHFATDEEYLRWLSEALIAEVLSEIEIPEEEIHGAE